MSVTNKLATPPNIRGSLNVNSIETGTYLSCKNNIKMNLFRINDLELPILPKDAANKEYVDSTMGGVIAGDGINKVGNVINTDNTVLRNFGVQTILDTTQSTDSATGCLVLKGGLGIEKDVFSSGEMNAVIFNSLSDVDYKNSISPIGPDTLSIVSNINAIEYKLNGYEDIHYGVSAQNLQEIGLDNIVKKSPHSDKLMVNYNDLVGLLIKCIQELTEKVNKLELK